MGNLHQCLPLAFGPEKHMPSSYGLLLVLLSQLPPKGCSATSAAWSCRLPCHQLVLAEPAHGLQAFGNGIKHPRDGLREERCPPQGAGQQSSDSPRGGSVAFRAASARRDTKGKLAASKAEIAKTLHLINKLEIPRVCFSKVFIIFMAPCTRRAQIQAVALAAGNAQHLCKSGLGYIPPSTRIIRNVLTVALNTLALHSLIHRLSAIPGLVHRRVCKQACRQQHNLSLNTQYASDIPKAQQKGLKRKKIKNKKKSGSATAAPAVAAAYPDGGYEKKSPQMTAALQPRLTDRLLVFYKEAPHLNSHALQWAFERALSKAPDSNLSILQYLFRSNLESKNSSNPLILNPEDAYMQQLLQAKLRHRPTPYTQRSSATGNVKLLAKADSYLAGSQVQKHPCRASLTYQCFRCQRCLSGAIGKSPTARPHNTQHRDQRSQGLEGNSTGVPGQQRRCQQRVVEDSRGAFQDHSWPWGSEMCPDYRFWLCSEGTTGNSAASLLLHLPVFITWLCRADRIYLLQKKHPAHNGAAPAMRRPGEQQTETAGSRSCPSQSSTNVRTKHTGPPHHHGPAVPELLHQHIEKKLSLLLKEHWQRAQQWEQNRSYCVSGSQVSSLPLAVATTTGLPFQTVFYVCRALASATAYCGTLQAAYTVPQPLEEIKPSLGIGLATGVHSPVKEPTQQACDQPCRNANYMKQRRIKGPKVSLALYPGLSTHCKLQTTASSLKTLLYAILNGGEQLHRIPWCILQKSLAANDLLNARLSTPLESPFTESIDYSAYGHAQNLRCILLLANTGLLPVQMQRNAEMLQHSPLCSFPGAIQEAIQNLKDQKGRENTERNPHLHPTTSPTAQCSWTEPKFSAEGAATEGLAPLSLLLPPRAAAGQDFFPPLDLLPPEQTLLLADRTTKSTSVWSHSSEQDTTARQARHRATTRLPSIKYGSSKGFPGGSSDGARGTDPACVPPSGDERAANPFQSSQLGGNMETGAGGKPLKIAPVIKRAAGTRAGGWQKPVWTQSEHLYGCLEALLVQDGD
ncbi:hypothetical protein Anapl_16369 [Anas platyrhynchos]|uniref:Uncharacterized protein n=1 Tax=Anas platyrhynchos TaxID=8839 RepID=R0JF07_ANAPL|nr:hypothetical protein Anapl_16369 [Anas platyrhynchos]